MLLGIEDITVNWGYPLVCALLLTLVVPWPLVIPIFLIVLDPE